VDAVRHYFDDLLGEKFIHYVPNAGHSLGDGEQAMAAVSAFFATVASGKPHPGLSWTTASSYGQIVVEVEADDPQGFNLHLAESKSRDFRKAKWSVNNDHLASEGGLCEVRISPPDEGHRAFYIEVLFENPLGGTYSKCTRVFVANREGIIE
jgi:PhoPQ-activated pathogenicity-related protein